MSSALENVVPLSEAFTRDQLVAKNQWGMLHATGLRPSIMLDDERAVLDKAAHNVLGLTAKERDLLDGVYGEVFNAAGAVRITDEEHLLRAYVSGDPYQYIKDNMGLVAQDNYSSGLASVNADVLRDCIKEKVMPAPCFATPVDVREGLQVYTESTRVYTMAKEPTSNTAEALGLR